MKDILRMSFDALLSHKLRSFLTMLGVVIGIGAVIVMATVGNSVQYEVIRQWEIFDPTGMVVGVGSNGEQPTLSLASTPFTNYDVEHIQRISFIEYAAPIGNIPIQKITYNGETKFGGGALLASSPSIIDVMNVKIEKGRNFVDGEKEIVIGPGIINFFGEDNPLEVGSVIWIQRMGSPLPIKAEIVGILEKSSTVMMQLTNAAIFGPVDPYYSKMLSMLGRSPHIGITPLYSMILSTAISIDDVEPAKKEIVEYLESDESDAYHLKVEEDDFVIITQQYIISRINQIMAMLNQFVILIATISLAVGAIGIANIMFANVTERTREIGTMMALGARRNYILQLFLSQSIIIGLVGGIIGCAMGAVGGHIAIFYLNQYMQGLIEEFSPLTIIYPIEWFFIAVFVGVFTGMIAGLIPARKASKMNPVEALRYE